MILVEWYSSDQGAHTVLPSLHHELLRSLRWRTKIVSVPARAREQTMSQAIQSNLTIGTPYVQYATNVENFVVKNVRLSSYRYVLISMCIDSETDLEKETIIR